MDWGFEMLDYDRVHWNVEFLAEVEEKIWNNLKILVKIGRDHGKTWAMIKLFVRWILEKRTKVICICTPAKLDEIYQAVDMYLRSDAIRYWYGDVVVRSGVKVGIWLSATYFRRLPTGAHMVGANFSVQPAEGSITGLHADHGWMHLEDPVQDVLVSDEAERKRWRWFKRTVRYIKGRGTKQTGTGTAKDIDDFYHKMETETRFPVYTIPTLKILEGRLPTEEEVKEYIDDDEEIVNIPFDTHDNILHWPPYGTFEFSGCYNWPPEMALYEFIIHPDDAHAELNNDPLPLQGFEFNLQDWEDSLIDPIDEEKESLNKFIVVDPGFGQGGSKTAILVFAIYFKNLVLVDARVKHYGSTAFVKAILSLARIHNAEEVCLEDNFVQVSRTLTDWNPLTNLSTLKLFDTPKSSTKRARISLLGFPFEMLHFKIYRTCPQLINIKQEFLTFTSDLSDAEIKKKFNALDAWSIAWQRYRKRLGLKRTGRGRERSVKSRRARQRRPY